MILPLEYWSGLVVAYLPRFAAAVLVLAAFWALARIAARALERLAARSEDEKATALELFADAVHYGLLAFGFVTALGTAGVQVGALVAGLGLTGFALGFALKDALSNLLAGAMILLYRPFKRGETIRVAGHQGRVTDIDLRYTTLEAGEKRFLVPNAVLLNNPISIEND